MRNFVYPVTLKADGADGGYVVRFRDLPEAITQGETVEGALEEAAGALQAAFEWRIAQREEIPAASRVRKGEHLVAVPVTTALKAALHLAMREEAVSNLELARRLGVDEKEIRRALDMRHVTKAPRLENALHAMGRQVEIRVA